MLDTMKEVLHYSARLKVVGMASSAATGSGIIINGMDPGKEKLVSDIYQYIPDTAGTWFETNRSNSIVIGRKLADKLKIKLRSKIVLTFQDKQGNIAASAFKVEGIYKSLNTSFDEINVYVRDEEMLKLIGFDEGQVHEIAVCLYNDVDNDKVTTRLQSNFPLLSIESWKEIMPDLGMMSDFTMMWLYIIMVIILLALSFGIINTMMMAVLERTREIGMLLALGMTRKKVFRMIMLETIFLSLTGGLIGMVLGECAVWFFSTHGLDLSKVAKGLEDMGYSAILYPSLGLDFCAGLTLLVIITGILSSIMPARRALKLKPVEAIRTL
jgi:putative ABC transport system permease protein